LLKPEAPAGIRSSRFMKYPLVGQRSKKFKPKTETIFRTDDRRQVRAGGHIKFNFEQVPRAQQDAGIKNHATLAEFGAPARNHGGGKPFCGDDSNGQIDGNTRPAARLMGDKHSSDHLLFPARIQITEVQAGACSTVQWATPAIFRRFWHAKCWARVPSPHGGHELRLRENAATKKTEIPDHAEWALTHLR
jgi:hypothetical protein